MAKSKPQLQKLNIQTVLISKIKCAKYNPRRAFTKAELKSFEGEMDKFSCLEPLIWNKKTGNLVGGRKRLAWFKKRGATEVEVNVVNLSEKDEKLLNVALNRQGQGVWDSTALSTVLSEFKIDDLELTGFSEIELKSNSRARLELEPISYQKGEKLSFHLTCNLKDEKRVKDGLNKLAKEIEGVAWW